MHFKPSIVVISKYGKFFLRIRLRCWNGSTWIYLCFSIDCKSHLIIGFIPIRKVRQTTSRNALKKTYNLEYGADTLEIHKDACAAPSTNVLIVDDVLATGGTA